LKFWNKFYTYRQKVSAFDKDLDKNLDRNLNKNLTGKDFSSLFLFFILG